MTSVSFFHVLIVNNRGKSPKGWDFSSFLYTQGVGVLNSFFARRWGIRPSKNCLGGWSGFELTDTLDEK